MVPKTGGLNPTISFLFFTLVTKFAMWDFQVGGQPCLLKEEVHGEKAPDLHYLQEERIATWQARWDSSYHLGFVSASLTPNCMTTTFMNE